jgi:glutathione S-transferase
MSIHAAGAEMGAIRFGRDGTAMTAENLQKLLQEIGTRHDGSCTRLLTTYVSSTSVWLLSMAGATTSPSEQRLEDISMITLYVAGPNFGLPDASPFVSKAEILLKMSGVPHRTAKADFRKAPKGKIPYIEENGRLLGDSTFIRFLLEENYGADFDKGLSASEKAVALAFEKLCEEHLYWAIVHARWMDKANFEKGPKKFFTSIPALVRPFVVAMIHRSVKRNMKGHGLGRHSRAEIERLAARDLDAISAFLGSKPFLMGETPCGADASVWSMVAGALSPHFETPIRDHAESLANLVAYRDRGLKRWFPEFAEKS